MAEIKTPTIGNLVTPLTYDGADFRALLADSSGRLLLLAGFDGATYHMLKTDNTGKLLCTISGLPTDAATLQGHSASDFVFKSGDTMTGLLLLSADPSADLGAVTKQYADGKLAKAGGTLIGSLILNADPGVDLGAATKQYVDARLLKSGGTMTGELVLNADPTADLGAATKQYVLAHAVSPGTNRKTVWEPRAPPASPSAYDDEFSDASINAALWSHWDPGNRMAANEGALGMNLLHGPANANDIAGELQQVTDQALSVWTNVSILSGLLNYNVAGLVLGRDLALNPNTTAVVLWALHFEAAGPGIYAQLFTDYKTWSSNYISISPIHGQTSMWLRMRVDAGVGNIYFDYSDNGVGWIQAGLVSKPWNYKQIGLAGQATGPSWQCNAYYQFFRIVTGSGGPYTVMNGNTISLWG